MLEYDQEDCLVILNRLASPNSLHSSTRRSTWFHMRSVLSAPVVTYVRSLRMIVAPCQAQRSTHLDQFTGVCTKHARIEIMLSM